MLQGKTRAYPPLTPPEPLAIPRGRLGDELQGAAGDCNSPEATHAWFDSRVAHHFTPLHGRLT